jgi:hypothetical protein
LEKQIKAFDYAEARALYKEKYPKYLFFSENEFDEIVKRNKLTVSTIDKYTGLIPEHCLEDILNENIDKSDIKRDKFRMDIRCNGTQASVYIEERMMEKIIKGTSSDILNYMKRLNCSYSEMDSFLHIAYLKNLTAFTTYLEKEESFSSLYIAAPAKDMNIPNPDPIVFRYVKDGVLVITFWK